MLPSPMSPRIQRLTTNLVLVIVVLALPLVPARHVLIPLWPRPVDEVILVTADDNAGQRVFLDTRRHTPEDVIVARDRPRSLVVVERFDEAPIMGFLVAVRPSAEGPLEPLPEELTDERIPGPALGPGALVLARADEQTIEIASDRIRRLYRPNQFDVSQRIALLWTRVVERLRQRMGKEKTG
jgi:hypothetical protein